MTDHNPLVILSIPDWLAGESHVEYLCNMNRLCQLGCCSPDLARRAEHTVPHANRTLMQASFLILVHKMQKCTKSHHLSIWCTKCSFALISFLILVHHMERWWYSIFVVNWLYIHRLIQSSLRKLLKLLSFFKVESPTLRFEILINSWVSFEMISFFLLRCFRWISHYGWFSPGLQCAAHLFHGWKCRDCCSKWSRIQRLVCSHQIWVKRPESDVTAIARLPKLQRKQTAFISNTS